MGAEVWERLSLEPCRAPVGDELQPGEGEAGNALRLQLLEHVRDHGDEGEAGGVSLGVSREGRCQLRDEPQEDAVVGAPVQRLAARRRVARQHARDHAQDLMQQAEASPVNCVVRDSASASFNSLIPLHSEDNRATDSSWIEPRAICSAECAVPKTARPNYTLTERIVLQDAYISALHCEPAQACVLQKRRAAAKMHPKVGTGPAKHASFLILQVPGA